MTSPPRTVRPENGHHVPRRVVEDDSNPYPFNMIRPEAEWSGTCPFRYELLWMSLVEKK